MGLEETPYRIGDAAFGGYVAGVIDTTQSNIITADEYQTGAKYLLIISPASLETSGLAWYAPDNYSGDAAKTRWEGLAAQRAALAEHATDFEIFNYCDGLAHPSDDGTEWYLPSLDEMEVLYRNLKPTTDDNTVGSDTDNSFPGTDQDYGDNPSSDPTGIAYTATDPSQTDVADFQQGGSEAFVSPTENYWTASWYSTFFAWSQVPGTGRQAPLPQDSTSANRRVRPVRRVYWDDLNDPPDAPTLSYPVAVSVDRTATVRMSWDFNDPDSGDSQSKFDLQVRPQGSATLTVDTSTETPNQYHDVASGTFSVDDYEWRVRTYDAQGEQGPWSTWEPFSAIEPPPGPTITDPTAGQTIPTEDYTVRWSSSERDAYQLRRVADDAGVADETTVFFDTGQVNSSGARSRSVNFETNGRWEHVQIRVLKDGLWSSPWVSVRVEVSYTAPAIPSLTVVEDDPSGALSVLVDQGDWPVVVSEVSYTGTGDGTLTGPTATDGTTDSHDWEAECVATATDGGTFDVSVDGTVVGQATVGTEFTYEGLSFTINDGATDFALGDTFAWSTSAIKVTSNDLWRRQVDDTGDGIRVAAEVARGGSFVDWAVASDVEYAYRARAQGDNQTTAWGAWTETPSEMPHTIVDGGDADSTHEPAGTLDGGSA